MTSKLSENRTPGTKLANRHKIRQVGYIVENLLENMQK
jgi:hypothetical protein